MQLYQEPMWLKRSHSGHLIVYRSKLRMAWKCAPEDNIQGKHEHCNVSNMNSQVQLLSICLNISFSGDFLTDRKGQDNEVAHHVFLKIKQPSLLKCLYNV